MRGLMDFFVVVFRCLIGRSFDFSWSLLLRFRGDVTNVDVSYRLNYILWLEDLLTSTAASDAPASSRDTPCRGIDMYVRLALQG